MALSRAKLTGTVTWSGGQPFDGFVAIAIATPTVYEGTPPTLSFAETNPRQVLPWWTTVPIKDGAYNQNTRLFYNADINPPGCRYAAYFYDINRRLIAPNSGAAVLFDITTDPYTLVAPTLTTPTTATVAPSVEVLPVTGPATVISQYDYITVSGAQTSTNGVDGNNTFTLSASPAVLQITKNGVLQTPTTSYTRSGAVITFTMGNHPLVADTLLAFGG